MISMRTSKLASSRLEIYLAVLLTFISTCVFTVCMVCFSFNLYRCSFCYFGFCFGQLPPSAQVSMCHVESSSSLRVAPLVHYNTPKSFNTLSGIDAVRLWVSLSSRSGVSLQFQPPVAFRRSLVVGTTALVLYGYLHAGGQKEFDIVSLLFVLIICLFKFKYVLICFGY